MADRRGVRVALAVLGLIGAVLATLTTPAAAAPSATGKYYVVAEQSGGQRESLYEIAVKALGNGGRSQEIFKLNEGRPQPDGGRLTDPLVLTPGWILILPSDARGSGVHSGPLPTVPVAPSATGSPTVSLSPSAAASELPAQNTVVLFGGVCVAFILLITAVAVLQGGRRRAGPDGPDGDSGPTPAQGGYDDRVVAVVTNSVVEPVARLRRPDGPAPAESGSGRRGEPMSESRGPVFRAARPGAPDRSGAGAPSGPGVRSGPVTVPAPDAGPGSIARPDPPARSRPPAGSGASARPDAPVRSRPPAGSGAPVHSGAPARSGPPARLAAQDWPAPGDRRARVDSRPRDGRSGEGGVDAALPPGDGHAGDSQSRAKQLDGGQVGQPAEDPNQGERRLGGHGRPGTEDGWPAHGDDWSDNEGGWPESQRVGPDDSALSANPERPIEVWPEPDGEQQPARPDSGGGDSYASRPSEQGMSPAAGSGGSRPGTTDERHPGADARPPRSGTGMPARPAAVARPGNSPGLGDRPGEPDVSRSSEDTKTVRQVEASQPGAGRVGGEGLSAVGERDSHAHEDNPDGRSRQPSDDLVAELVADGGRVAVSLVGATGDGPGVAYGWRSAGQAPPVAALPVVLGDRDGRYLHLDLGRCPDVLTVAGSVPDCEKYALRLIRQVLANGHGVAVIGNGLFGDALPAGCRRVTTMADIRGLDSPGIVVCGHLTGPDVAAARLSRASGGPTPVIIGEVARSRWTLRVNPA